MAIAEDAHDELSPGGTTLPPKFAGVEPVSVLVTGTARGTNGWSAPLTPYRVDCLLTPDPVRGWFVDDIATEPVTPPAAAGVR